MILPFQSNCVQSAIQTLFFLPIFLHEHFILFARLQSIIKGHAVLQCAHEKLTENDFVRFCETFHLIDVTLK